MLPAQVSEISEPDSLQDLSFNCTCTGSSNLPSCFVATVFACSGGILGECWPVLRRGLAQCLYAVDIVVGHALKRGAVLLSRAVFTYRLGLGTRLGSGAVYLVSFRAFSGTGDPRSFLCSNGAVHLLPYLLTSAIIARMIQVWRFEKVLRVHVDGLRGDAQGMYGGGQWPVSSRG
jgi:hypothetical protein